MPTGLCIVRWNEKTGVEPVAAYPEETAIPEKTLLQIYAQHEFTGEAGLVSLVSGNLNIASYFTGKETSVYIILILTPDEDADQYEEGLGELSRQILAQISDPSALGTVLGSIFQRLSVYPSLNDEQRLAILFESETKRMVIKRLREEVMIPKSEIAIWLKDKYKEGFVDLDNLISGLIKIGLVKSASVKGISSDMVFLVQDIIMFRRPPAELIKDPVGHHLPESLRSAYLTEIKNFFKAYKPSEADNITVIGQVILNPQSYEVLKLLREAIVTRNDIEKLRKKGVDDVDKVLRDLYETKMINIIQDDKGVEYYYLASDFYIGKIYPKYILDIIRDQYRNKSQNGAALLKALDLLKEEYELMILGKSAKNKTEKKGKTEEEVEA